MPKSRSTWRRKRTIKDRQMRSTTWRHLTRCPLDIPLNQRTERLCAEHKQHAAQSPPIRTLWTHNIAYQVLDAYMQQHVQGKVGQLGAISTEGCTNQVCVHATFARADNGLPRARRKHVMQWCGEPPSQQGLNSVAIHQTIDPGTWKTVAHTWRWNYHASARCPINVRH